MAIDKQQAETVAEALLAEPRARQQQRQERRRQRLARARRPSRLVSAGALVGLAVGWAVGEALTGEAFPANVLCAAVGALGGWLANGRGRG